MLRFGLIVFLELVALSFGDENNQEIVVNPEDRSPRIVGGNFINITEAPYQVGLMLEGLIFFCGGSLISESVVLTAAHCVNIFKYIKSTISVVAGATSLYSSQRVTRGVAKIQEHPMYDDQTFNFDVSILFLDAPYKFGATINKIGLPSANEALKNNTKVFVTGWGSVSYGGSPSIEQLQGVMVSVVDPLDCRRNLGTAVTENMICAGVPEGGKDACQCDSGGPMVSSGKLYGIVSFGADCALPGVPGVYTAVAKIRDFVKQTAGI